MRKKPLTQDAKILLQLNRLRKETEMRRARAWWHDDFWPENVGDYLKIELAHGTNESFWLKQVATYWGMAASFVLHGTLSEKVFLDATFSGDMFVIFAKVGPFLKELRDKTRNPDLMRNIEIVIMGSKTGRQRLRQISKRVEARRRMLTRSTAKKE